MQQFLAVAKKNKRINKNIIYLPLKHPLESIRNESLSQQDDTSEDEFDTSHLSEYEDEKERINESKSTSSSILKMIEEAKKSKASQFQNSTMKPKFIDSNAFKLNEKLKLAERKSSRTSIRERSSKRETKRSNSSSEDGPIPRKRGVPPSKPYYKKNESPKRKMSEKN